MKVSDMDLPELRGLVYRAASEGVEDAMRLHFSKITMQLEALHSHLDTVQRNVREELLPASVREAFTALTPSGKVFTHAELVAAAPPKPKSPPRKTKKKKGGRRK